MYEFSTPWLNKSGPALRCEATRGGRVLGRDPPRTPGDGADERQTQEAVGLHDP